MNRDALRITRKGTKVWEVEALASDSLDDPYRYFDLGLQSQAGVHVHAFHSLGEALWRFSFLRVLNRRDHRKLLVLDDRVAYFGGMNIVDAGSTLSALHAEHLPHSAGWRDIHVRLVGPQQGEIAESFERSWRRAHREPVPRRPPEYRRVQLPDAAEFLRFFDTGPSRRHIRASRLFTRRPVHLIRPL